MASLSTSSPDDDAAAHNNNNNNKWSAQTADLYSSHAARLTELHGADLITILKDDILQAKTILDVGCGTGAFAKAYLQQFPAGIPGQTLILTDLSEDMLLKAQETVVPAIGFQTKIVFQVEDGTKLEGIADDSVDLVVSLFALFLIPDQTAALQAVARVLQKNPNTNVFANASWMFGLSDYFSSQGFGVSLQDAFKLPNDMMIDPTKDADSVTKWATPRSIQDMLLAEHVGFDQLRCFPAIHNTVWEFEPLWTMMVQNPMSAISSASPEDVAKAKAATLDFVTQNGQIAIDEPHIMLSTASLLTVVRGFGGGLAHS